MPRKKKKQRTRKTVTNTNVVNVSNRIVLGARYIRSRRRPNLRELRQAMPPDPRAFHNPAYYGNVAMLTNSALSQFQNQRYSMERELPGKLRCSSLRPTSASSMPRRPWLRSSNGKTEPGSWPMLSKMRS